MGGLMACDSGALSNRARARGKVPRCGMEEGVTAVGASSIAE